MHDQPGTPQPGTPEPSNSEPPRSDVGGQGAEHDVALQNVRAVMSWYRQEVFRERQTGGPNGARLKQLTAALRECVADQQALEQAGPEEAQRITALYRSAMPH